MSFGKFYMDKLCIKVILEKLEYLFYYLDFEIFGLLLLCFKGEKVYD